MLENSPKLVLQRHIADASLFHYYAKLVANEFKGNTPHEVYELSFSRLLKKFPERAIWDDRFSELPIMAGTDERDLFLPLVKQAVSRLQEASTILDIGAGDGQTFSRFSSKIPKSTTIDFIEPNKNYADAYMSEIQHREDRLSLGSSFVETFKSYFNTKRFDAKSKYDLILCLHSIYFVGDVQQFIEFLQDSLKIGGRALLVFADETRCFTGCIVQNYLEKMDTEKAEQFHKRAKARKYLFHNFESVCPEKATRVFQEFVGHKRIAIRHIQSQPAKLFGNDIGDIIALGFLTDLSFCDNQSWDKKVSFVTEFIRDHPHLVGLAVEVDGPRSHTFSVSEPQVVIEVERIE